MPYVQSWSNSTPAGTLTITVSGVTAGSTLLFFGVTDTASPGDLLVGTFPSGFSIVETIQTTADNSTLIVAKKDNASGSEGALSFTLNSTNTMIGGVLECSNVDFVSPLDVAAVKAGSGAGSAASPWTIAASITPVTNGCELFAFMCSDTTSSGDAVHSIGDTLGLTWAKPLDLNSGFHNGAAFVATQAAAAAETITGTGTLAAASAGRSIIILALRSAASIEQEGFRFGSDDGAENSHSWLAAQDTGVTQPLSQNILLSILLNVSGSPGAKTFNLQHRKVGDTAWINTPTE